MIYERFIKLTIDSKIDSVALLSKAVRAVCGTVVEDEVYLYNLELCIVEATTNVINHAYHRKPGNLVEITVTLDHRHILFQIVDSGEKLSLPQIKKELDYDPNDLTTWPEFGMGLFLMHKLMDEISFTECEGKNVLTMTKYLDENITNHQI